MKHNMRKHEFAGILLIFIGGTSIGVALYNIIWSALRNHILIIKDIIMFPALLGIGLLLLEFGKIELKEMRPGKRR